MLALNEQTPEHDDLPESLQEIADAIGREGAMHLVENCGGTRVFVPRKMRVQHKLVTLLGFEQARKLSQYFGGETLTVVRNAQLLRRERNREIIRRYDAGTGVRQLALDNNLTERQIYAILSSMP
ncbi:hypothetical protein SIID45300_01031 [Candidatus Magnetaquicoccaceae bacterium FCR-1]|uniref:Mor transcription activator domain-containing protein n=1 Tax=Candidatus Magnetaquiglobus chichijimensis TaxID=3141448 RepID=A0ABQ0C7P7_9PROT